MYIRPSPYFGHFLKKLSSFAEDLWVVLTKNGQQFFLKNFKVLDPAAFRAMFSTYTTPKFALRLYLFNCHC